METIRDIAIIILAIESIVIGIALVLTLLELRSLTNLLRNEIAPMLESAGQTVNIVKGTADFVGDSVVRPVIAMASFGAKAKRVIELVVHNGRSST